MNAAARLTELAKEVPGGLLASAESTGRADAHEQRHWESAGGTVLRGRSAETELSRLAAPPS